MVQVLNPPEEKAQKTARKRRKCMRKRKSQQIFMVQQAVIKEEEPEIVPPFLLDVQLVTTSHAMWTKALIDSGADCNVLSYETWVSLDKPTLESCQVAFQSFSDTQSSCLGKICLKVRIQTEAMYITFYVANKNHKGFAVLLGRSWMCSTNCRINLRTREYALEVNSVNLTGKDTEENVPTKEKTSNQATSSSHAQPSQQWRPKKQQLFQPHNQVQGRGERQQLYYWRPKAATKPTDQPQKAPPTTKVHQRSQRQPKAVWKWLPKDRLTQEQPARSAKAKPVKSEAKYSSKYAPQGAITMKWIPKTILHAQGYYSGNTMIWVPKLLHKAPTIQSPPLVRNKATPKPQVLKSEPTTQQYVWRVKADYNKRKYPAKEESTKATSSAGNDLPSTSHNSTTPAKGELLQRLLFHLMPSETMPFTAWLTLGTSS